MEDEPELAACATRITSNGIAMEAAEDVSPRGSSAAADRVMLQKAFAQADQDDGGKERSFGQTTGFDYTFTVVR